MTIGLDTPGHSLIFALLLTLPSLGSQTIKAAFVNPAAKLKND
jgi:hypothetical protein